MFSKPSMDSRRSSVCNHASTDWDNQIKILEEEVIHILANLETYTQPCETCVIPLGHGYQRVQIGGMPAHGSYCDLLKTQRGSRYISKVPLIKTKVRLDPKNCGFRAKAEVSASFVNNMLKSTGDTAPDNPGVSVDEEIVNLESHQGWADDVKERH